MKPDCSQLHITTDLTIYHDDVWLHLHAVLDFLINHKSATTAIIIANGCNSYTCANHCHMVEHL